MKNIIRLAVAGALMAGYATAQAQATLPSNDASDLYLFVSDQAAGTTFAEDTGISINSLLPSSDMSSGANLKSVDDSINLAASSALTAYINAANNAGQALEWGVEAAQFPAVPTGGVDRPQGVEVAISDTTVSTGKITGMITANLQSWAAGFSGDATYFDTPIPTGGAVFAFTSGSVAGNVWGSGNDANVAGSVGDYGQGPDSTVALGSSATFYGVTANGGTGKLESYLLGGTAGTITLSADGTLTAGGSPVPLPPAVWLLGSGLLGLAGVGRRRAA